MLRRAFMTGGSRHRGGRLAGPLAARLRRRRPRAARSAASAKLRGGRPGGGGPQDPAARRPARRGRPLPARGGTAARRLRAARRRSRPGEATADRLHAGAGELAISVGWLAHDSGRFDDARSHYAEALATARMAGDDGPGGARLLQHRLPRARRGPSARGGTRRPGAQRAARPLGSPRLLSLLALREAGGWAGLADRSGLRAGTGPRAGPLRRGARRDADPEWMTFYGEAELEGLEAQCWSALGDWPRAARHARRAAELQDPHFTRNIALYTAELADDLARGGPPRRGRRRPGMRVLDLLGEVQSSRIQTMLAGTARVLLPHRRASGVSAFLDRHAGAAAHRVNRRRGAGDRAGQPPGARRSFQRLDGRLAVGPAEHGQRRRVQPDPGREVQRQTQPAGADGPQDVAVGEDQHVAVGGPGPADHLVGPGGDLGQRSRPRGPRRAR